MYRSGVATMNEDESAPKTKWVKAQFFHLVPHHSKSLTKYRPVAWADKLRNAVNATDPVLNFEDRNQVKYTFNMRGSSSAIIAKSMGDAQVRQVSGSDEILPVQLEDVDTYLAMVNHVYFYNDINAFAIMSGPPGTPRSNAGAGLANLLHPLGDRDYWLARPISSPGQIEEFKKAARIQSAQIRADVAPPDLLYERLETQNIGDTMIQVASLVGADIAIELQVKVKSPKQHGNATGLLKNFLNLCKLWPGAKKKKMQVVTAEGEILDLLDHKLIEQFGIPLLEGGVDPKLLVSVFENVCVGWHDRIREAVKAAEA